MGSIRNTMASMLAVLALTAFMSDADAQTRRSSQSSQTRSSSQSSQTRSSSQSSQTRRATSGSQTRQSSNDNKKSTASRPSAPSRQPSARPSSGADRKPSTTVTRPSASKPSTQNKPSVQTKPSDQKKPVTRPATRPSTGSAAKPSPSNPTSSKPSPGNKNDFKPGNQNKPVQVTRPAPNRPQGNNQNNRPGVRPDAGPSGGHGKPDKGHGMRPDNRPHGPAKPVQIRPDHRHHHPRVHPRDRDFMRWDRPSYYWSHNNHYYGYRVRILPSRALRHVYHGIVYYCYNDIWYRPYGSYYVVCRPPHGLSLAANIISDIAWTAVKLSYYNTVANTYSRINDNNAYIAEQNAIIAQNNATIAAQNATIVQNQQLAQTSYTLANELGLIQSYAAANSEYFYQDGVFYSKDASGEYRVILPPAGALVETLPEDFDMVTLADGNEYYKVDDTIYKVTVSEGKPYFEVVGQQYV